MGAVTIEVKYTSIAKISLNPSPSVIQPALRALCAESAKAVTGRRCPHSGVGEDFFARWPVFFTKTAVTWK